MRQFQLLVLVRALSISSLTAGQEVSTKTSKNRHLENVLSDLNQ